MKHIIRHIIITMCLILAAGCEDVPVAELVWKPEVVDICATADADSVKLTAKLNDRPRGDLECGFYVGTKMDKLERVTGTLEGTTFHATVQGLYRKTEYIYMAFISNGWNEILSDMDSFISRESADSPEPTDPSLHIIFSDKVMEELCVNAFDSNNDGHLSYSEAQAVTDISKMTLSRKTFRSFEEFRHFTAVREVPDHFFEGTGIERIRFPEKLNSIGNAAFKDCRYLKDITFASELEEIGNDAFLGCISLTELEIKGKDCTINNRAFSGCTNLQTVLLLEGICNINDSAFAKCSKLERISVPASAVIINADAFQYTSIKEVHISDLSSWMKITFANSAANPLAAGAELILNGVALTELEFPGDISQLKNYAFTGCTSIERVRISESISSVGRNAFFNCTGLKEAYIPESVNIIKGMAFYNCKSLTDIYLKASVPPLLDDLTPSFYPFDENAPGRIFHVPAGSAETYKADAGWTYYADSIKEYNY